MTQSTGPIYYAHSGYLSDDSDWQGLKDHLQSVAMLAKQRAEAFGAGDWAHLIGLLHDLGKYSKEFQARLHGSPVKVDHATAGAKVVMEHITNTMGQHYAALAKLLAFTLAGHHAGLANADGEGQERATCERTGVSRTLKHPSHPEMLAPSVRSDSYAIANEA